MKIENQRIVMSKEESNAIKESCSKDEFRLYMQKPFFSYVDSSIIATDGRKMIVFEMSENDDSIKEDCFIDLIQIKKSFFGITDYEYNKNNQFPNWKRVIPEKSDMTIVPNWKDNDFCITGKLEKDSVSLCKIIIETHMVINMDLIMKGLKGLGTFQILAPTEDNRALMVVGNNFTFVLMPIDKSNIR